MTKKRNKRHGVQSKEKLSASKESTNKTVETKADTVTASAPIVTQCVEPEPGGYGYYGAVPQVMSILPIKDADLAAPDDKLLKCQVEDYVYRHLGERQISPVCGLKKFYKNEFEAFEKYFTKIHSHPVGDPILIEINQEVLTLPDQPTCSLARQTTRPHGPEFFTEKFNVKCPPLPAPNKMIEFAHANIKIAEKDLRGRCLLSTTHLKPHTVLISEKATVLQIMPQCICTSSTVTSYQCHHCGFATSRFYRCATCNIVVFCSIKCRETSNTLYHQYECEALQRHFWDFKNSDFSYIAFRMVLYGAQNGFQCQLPKKSKKWGRTSYANNYCFVQRLISNFFRIPVMKVYEVLRKSAKTVLYLMTRTSFFHDFDKPVSIFLVGGLLVRHYFQAQMNCIYLKNNNFMTPRSVTGKAICPTIALLNHACYPNAAIVTCGDQLVVKALTNIEANQEITICYHPIRPSLLLADRWLVMEWYYYFLRPCMCKMCIWQNILKDHGAICFECAMKYTKEYYPGIIQTCLSCIEVQKIYTPFEKQVLEVIIAEPNLSEIQRLVLYHTNFAGDYGFTPFLDMHLSESANLAVLLHSNNLGDLLMTWLIRNRALHNVQPTNSEYAIELKMRYVLFLFPRDFQARFSISTEAERSLIHYIIDMIEQLCNDLLFYMPRELVASLESIIVPQLDEILLSYAKRRFT